MSNPRKIYWDSSCFICFLNKDEKERGDICDDILRHAHAGEVEIWISVWVIVEVIRPKRRGRLPLPEWAEQVIKESSKAVPEVRRHMEELWKRNQPNSPTPKFTPEQILKIGAMFEWPFIKKVQVDEPTARKAVELCRDWGLKPADAIHAATAILWKCSAIQRWDRDYDKVQHLIPSEDPQMMSAQIRFMRSFGPSPEEFNSAQEKESISLPAEVPRSDSGRVEDQAGAEGGEAQSKEPQESD